MTKAIGLRTKLFRKYYQSRNPPCTLLRHHVCALWLHGEDAYWWQGDIGDGAAKNVINAHRIYSVLMQSYYALSTSNSPANYAAIFELIANGSSFTIPCTLLICDAFLRRGSCFVKVYKYFQFFVFVEIFVETWFFVILSSGSCFFWYHVLRHPVTL